MSADYIDFYSLHAMFLT